MNNHWFTKIISIFLIFSLIFQMSAPLVYADMEQAREEHEEAYKAEHGGEAPPEGEFEAHWERITGGGDDDGNGGGGGTPSQERATSPADGGYQEWVNAGGDGSAQDYINWARAVGKGEDEIQAGVSSAGGGTYTAPDDGGYQQYYDAAMAAEPGRIVTPADYAKWAEAVGKSKEEIQKGLATATGSGTDDGGYSQYAAERVKTGAPPPTEKEWEDYATAVGGISPEDIAKGKAAAAQTTKAASAPEQPTYDPATPAPSAAAPAAAIPTPSPSQQRDLQAEAQAACAGVGGDETQCQDAYINGQYQPGIVEIKNGKVVNINWEANWDFIEQTGGGATANTQTAWANWIDKKYNEMVTNIGYDPCAGSPDPDCKAIRTTAYTNNLGNVDKLFNSDGTVNWQEVVKFEAENNHSVNFGAVKDSYRTIKEIIEPLESSLSPEEANLALALINQQQCDTLACKLDFKNEMEAYTGGSGSFRGFLEGQGLIETSKSEAESMGKIVEEVFVEWTKNVRKNVFGTDFLGEKFKQIPSGLDPQEFLKYLELNKIPKDLDGQSLIDWINKRLEKTQSEYIKAALETKDKDLRGVVEPVTMGALARRGYGPLVQAPKGITPLELKSAKDKFTDKFILTDEGIQLTGDGLERLGETVVTRHKETVYKQTIAAQNLQDKYNLSAKAKALVNAEKLVPGKRITISTLPIPTSGFGALIGTSISDALKSSVEVTLGQNGIVTFQPLAKKLGGEPIKIPLHKLIDPSSPYFKTAQQGLATKQGLSLEEFSLEEYRVIDFVRAGRPTLQIPREKLPPHLADWTAVELQEIQNLKDAERIHEIVEQRGSMTDLTSNEMQRFSNTAINFVANTYNVSKQELGTEETGLELKVYRSNKPNPNDPTQKDYWDYRNPNIAYIHKGALRAKAKPVIDRFGEQKILEEAIEAVNEVGKQYGWRKIRLYDNPETDLTDEQKELLAALILTKKRNKDEHLKEVAVTVGVMAGQAIASGVVTAASGGLLLPIVALNIVMSPAGGAAYAWSDIQTSKTFNKLMNAKYGVGWQNSQDPFSEVTMSLNQAAYEQIQQGLPETESSMRIKLTTKLIDQLDLQWGSGQIASKEEYDKRKQEGLQRIEEEIKNQLGQTFQNQDILPDTILIHRENPEFIKAYNETIHKMKVTTNPVTSKTFLPEDFQQFEPAVLNAYRALIYSENSKFKDWNLKDISTDKVDQFKYALNSLLPDELDVRENARLLELPTQQKASVDWRNHALDAPLGHSMVDAQETAQKSFATGMVFDAALANLFDIGVAGISHAIKVPNLAKATKYWAGETLEEAGQRITAESSAIWMVGKDAYKEIPLPAGTVIRPGMEIASEIIPEEGVRVVSKEAAEAITTQTKWTAINIFKKMPENPAELLSRRPNLLTNPAVILPETRLSYAPIDLEAGQILRLEPGDALVAEDGTALVIPKAGQGSIEVFDSPQLGVRFESDIGKIEGEDLFKIPDLEVGSTVNQPHRTIIAYDNQGNKLGQASLVTGKTSLQPSYKLTPGSLIGDVDSAGQFTPALNLADHQGKWLRLSRQLPDGRFQVIGYNQITPDMTIRASFWDHVDVVSKKVTEVGETIQSLRPNAVQITPDSMIRNPLAGIAPENLEAAISKITRRGVEKAIKEGLEEIEEVAAPPAAGGWRQVAADLKDRIGQATRGIKDFFLGDDVSQAGKTVEKELAKITDPSQIDDALKMRLAELEVKGQKVGEIIEVDPLIVAHKESLERQAREAAEKAAKEAAPAPAVVKKPLSQIEKELLEQEAKGGPVPKIDYPDADTPIRFKQPDHPQPKTEELWWTDWRNAEKRTNEMLEALKQRAREIAKATDLDDSEFAVDLMTFEPPTQGRVGMAQIAYEAGKPVKFHVDFDMIYRLTNEERDRLLLHELIHVHDYTKGQGREWAHLGGWSGYRWTKRAETLFEQLQHPPAEVIEQVTKKAAPAAVPVKAPAPTQNIWQRIKFQNEQGKWFWENWTSRKPKIVIGPAEAQGGDISIAQATDRVSLEFYDSKWWATSTEGKASILAPDGTKTPLKPNQWVEVKVGDKLKNAAETLELLPGNKVVSSQGQTLDLIDLIAKKAKPPATPASPKEPGKGVFAKIGGWFENLRGGTKGQAKHALQKELSDILQTDDVVKQTRNAILKGEDPVVVLRTQADEVLQTWAQKQPAEIVAAVDGDRILAEVIERAKVQAKYQADTLHAGLQQEIGGSIVDDLDKTLQQTFKQEFSDLANAKTTAGQNLGKRLNDWLVPGTDGQTHVFKQTYDRAIKQGLSPDEATALAKRIETDFITSRQALIDQQVRRIGTPKTIKFGGTPAKIEVAVGDLHGDWDQFVRLGNGQIQGQGAATRPKFLDANGNWIGGKNTRVHIMGDLVDRAPEGQLSAETAHKVMRLQQQAGVDNVVVYLGNHDAIMVKQMRKFDDLVKNNVPIDKAAERVSIVYGPPKPDGKPTIYKFFIDPEDIKYLHRHREVLEWMKNLPAMGKSNRVLYFHSDTVDYRLFGNTIEEINQNIRNILRNGQATFTDGFGRQTTIDIDNLSHYLTQRQTTDPRLKRTTVFQTDFVNDILTHFDADNIVHAHARSTPPIDLRVKNVDWTMSAGYHYKPQRGDYALEEEFKQALEKWTKEFPNRGMVDVTQEIPGQPGTTKVTFPPLTTKPTVPAFKQGVQVLPMPPADTRPLWKKLLGIDEPFRAVEPTAAERGFFQFFFNEEGKFDLLAPFRRPPTAPVGEVVESLHPAIIKHPKKPGLLGFFGRKVDSVDTPIGKIPVEGEIKISALKPHEPGYNLLKVEEYQKLISEGVEFDPIDITVLNNKIYSWDGAHRTTAHLAAGKDSINYRFTPFDEITDVRRKELLIAIDEGNLEKIGAPANLKVPERYDLPERLQFLEGWEEFKKKTAPEAAAQPGFFQRLFGLVQKEKGGIEVGAPMETGENLWERIRKIFIKKPKSQLMPATVDELKTFHQQQASWYKGRLDSWYDLATERKISKIVNEDGDIIGTILGNEKTENWFRVGEIIIDPEYQGKDYGTNIIKQLQKQYEKIDLMPDVELDKTLTGETLETAQTRLESFYTNLGFVEKDAMYIWQKSPFVQKVSSDSIDGTTNNLIKTFYSESDNPLTLYQRIRTTAPSRSLDTFIATGEKGEALAIALRNPRTNLVQFKLAKGVEAAQAKKAVEELLTQVKNLPEVQTQGLAISKNSSPEVLQKILPKQKDFITDSTGRLILPTADPSSIKLPQTKNITAVIDNEITTITGKKYLVLKVYDGPTGTELGSITYRNGVINVAQLNQEENAEQVLTTVLKRIQTDIDPTVGQIHVTAKPLQTAAENLGLSSHPYKGPTYIIPQKTSVLRKALFLPVSIAGALAGWLGFSDLSARLTEASISQPPPAYEEKPDLDTEIAMTDFELGLQDEMQELKKLGIEIKRAEAIKKEKQEREAEIKRRRKQERVTILGKFWGDFKNAIASGLQLINILGMEKPMWTYKEEKCEGIVCDKFPAGQYLPDMAKNITFLQSTPKIDPYIDLNIPVVHQSGYNTCSLSAFSAAMNYLINEGLTPTENLIHPWLLSELIDPKGELTTEEITSAFSKEEQRALLDKLNINYMTLLTSGKEAIILEEIAGVRIDRIPAPASVGVVLLNPSEKNINIAINDFKNNLQEAIEKKQVPIITLPIFDSAAHALAVAGIYEEAGISYLIAADTNFGDSVVFEEFQKIGVKKEGEYLLIPMNHSFLKALLKAGWRQTVKVSAVNPATKKKEKSSAQAHLAYLTAQSLLQPETKKSFWETFKEFFKRVISKQSSVNSNEKLEAGDWKLEAEEKLSAFLRRTSFTNPNHNNCCYKEKHPQNTKFTNKLVKNIGVHYSSTSFNKSNDASNENAPPNTPFISLAIEKGESKGIGWSKNINTNQATEILQKNSDSLLTWTTFNEIIATISSIVKRAKILVKPANAATSYQLPATSNLPMGDLPKTDKLLATNTSGFGKLMTNTDKNGKAQDAEAAEVIQAPSRTVLGYPRTVLERLRNIFRKKPKVPEQFIATPEFYRVLYAKDVLDSQLAGKQDKQLSKEELTEIIKNTLLAVDENENVRSIVNVSGNTTSITTNLDGRAYLPSTPGAYKLSVTPIDKKMKIYAPETVSLSSIGGSPTIQIGLNYKGKKIKKKQPAASFQQPVEKTGFGKLLKHSFNWLMPFAFAEETKKDGPWSTPRTVLDEIATSSSVSTGTPRNDNSLTTNYQLPTNNNVLAATSQQPQATSKVVTLQLYHDLNNNGQRDTEEPDVPWAGVEVNLEKQSSEETYHLLAGWNLINLPLEPTSIKMASDLLNDINQKGGNATTIAYFDNGSWKEFIQRENNWQYGQDFDLKPGVAYFVKNHKETDWTFSGNIIPAGSKTSLQAGWNGVGLRNLKTTSDKASDLLQKVNEIGCKPEECQITAKTQNADSLASWQSGLWETYLQRFKEIEELEEYGKNFTLDYRKGYLLRVKKDTDWIH